VTECVRKAIVQEFAHSPRLGDRALRNLDDLELPTQWEWITEEFLAPVMSGVNNRYTARRVVPFAGRVDNDDVACVLVEGEGGMPGEFVLLHNFAAPGWEFLGAYGTVYELIEAANNAME
jgi:hypothetical protein